MERMGKKGELAKCLSIAFETGSAMVLILLVACLLLLSLFYADKGKRKEGKWRILISSSDMTLR